MKRLIELLKVLLADTVTMKFIAHGYHWNVEGIEFSQYHELFGEIYEDVDSAIDPTAEDIRKLDAYAPFTFSDFVLLRTIKSEPVKSDPKLMSQSLLDVNEQMLTSLNNVFTEATKQNKQGIANFIAERIDMHEKWRWQLKVSVK
jgi:starvation-inducible DNA-binding protein